MLMKALIAGATGLVGGNCLRLLLEDDMYKSVISIGRRNLPIVNEKLEQHIVDFSKLEEYQDLFDVDHVFCCLGTTIAKAKSKENFRRVDYEYPLKMAQLSEQKGVQNFSIVSSLGANSNSPIFYNKVKGYIEGDISKLSIPKINILQPSMLLGDRSEKRLKEDIGKVVMKVLNPIMLGGFQKYRAITGEQVAKAMIFYAKNSNAGVNVYASDVLASI